MWDISDCGCSQPLRHCWRCHSRAARTPRLPSCSSPSTSRAASNNKALEIYNGTGAADQPGRRRLQRADVLQRQRNGWTDDQPDRHGRRGRRLRPGPVGGERGDPGTGRPDERLRLVQRRRRRRAPQGHDRDRRRSARSASTPGTEWGTGLTSTADNTLRRKLPIEAGDANGGDAFDPAVEWDGFATDNSRRARSAPRPAARAGADRREHEPGGRGGGCRPQLTPVRPVQRARERHRRSWYTLVCSATGTKTATVTANAASTLFALQPTTPFVGGESCTFTVIAAGVTDQDTDDPYDVMLADVTITFATNDTDPCCARSPRSRRFRGAVLGGRDGRGHHARASSSATTRAPSPALRGFFLQVRDRRRRPCTSDGIFVFNGNDSVNLGDVVYVTGKAEEFQDQTQIGRDTTVTRAVPAP